MLRQAGSLTQSMPPRAERPSSRTAVDGVLLLDGALSIRQAADLLGVNAGHMRQRLTARTLLEVHTGGVAAAGVLVPHRLGATWSGPGAGRGAR